jgi:hypothetical protein
MLKETFDARSTGARRVDSDADTDVDGDFTNARRRRHIDAMARSLAGFSASHAPPT